MNFRYTLPVLLIVLTACDANKPVTGRAVVDHDFTMEESDAIQMSLLSRRQELIYALAQPD